MRSLSRGPTLYSSLRSTDGFAVFLSSSFAAARGANAMKAARLVIETSVVSFMTATSVVVSVRFDPIDAAAPVHQGARHRGALQRVGIDGVCWIARGPDGDAHLRGELVVLDARHETIDHARGVFVVGIQQHDGERYLVGVAD